MDIEMAKKKPRYQPLYRPCPVCGKKESDHDERECLEKLLKNNATVYESLDPNDGDWEEEDHYIIGYCHTTEKRKKDWKRIRLA